jgi:uncharacterized protein
MESLTGLGPTGDGPQSIHPAIRNVWRFSVLITGLVMLVGFGAVEFVIRRSNEASLIPWIGPLIAIAITIYSYIMSEQNYRAWRYQLREHDLVLRYGVLWTAERCIARDRVQHIDINSGPLDRRFGLVQMTIYAAGGTGQIGTIPGLKPDEAEALRKALLERVAEDA